MGARGGTRPSGLLPHLMPSLTPGLGLGEAAGHGQSRGRSCPLSRTLRVSWSHTGSNSHQSVRPCLPNTGLRTATPAARPQGLMVHSWFDREVEETLLPEVAPQKAALARSFPGSGTLSLDRPEHVADAAWAVISRTKQASCVHLSSKVCTCV